MKNAVKTLTNFTTTNNSWILITCFIAISFMWVMRFDVEFGSMIYMHLDKFKLCIHMIGALIIAFSPAILFSLFRNVLREILPSLTYNILWIIIFVIYPFIAGLTSLIIGIIPVPMTQEVLLIFGFFLLGVEILTSPFSRVKLNLHLVNWKEKISPEWIVLALLIYMSLDNARKLIQFNAATGGFVFVWMQSLIYFALFYIFYRINHYYLINVIYKRKGMIYYAFAFIGLMALFYVPFALLTYYLPAFKTSLLYKSGEEWVGSGAPTAFWAMFSGALTRFMILTIPLAILIQWLRQGNEINLLQKENAETELNLLKQQINPHFFFNTLNNVYALSLTKDEKTSKGILQLSDLMRYVIYKGQEESVTLQEEINYIEDFLELQKLRLQQNLDLKFEIEVDNPEIQIAPLMFIILIENAFKHGIENAEKNAFLHIVLQQSKNHVFLSCLNSIEQGEATENQGLGLTNLKRRLQLIYPDNHKLVIDKRSDEFYAALTIDL